MKKLVILFCVLCAVSIGLVFAEPPAVNTVGDTSVCLMPSRPLQNAAAWATNTAYVNGQVTTVSNRFYMCITNGTSAASGVGPVHLDGEGTDGSLNWRQVDKYPYSRRGFSISNDGTNTLYVSFGVPAVAGAGTRLNGSGGTLTDSGSEVYQGRMYAICASGEEVNVAIQEW